MNDTRRPPLNSYTPARPLTGQQRRVVTLLVGGLTYQEIATGLGISRRTVRQYVEQVAMALPGDGKPLRRILRFADVLLAPKDMSL